MILIMRTALRAFVPANRVSRFQIMVSTGTALNSEMHTGTEPLEETITAFDQRFATRSYSWN